MEKECIKCSQQFNDDHITNEEALEWKVRYDGTKSVLMCPICFSQNETGVKD